MEEIPKQMKIFYKTAEDLMKTSKTMKDVFTISFASAGNWSAFVHYENSQRRVVTYKEYKEHATKYAASLQEILSSIPKDSFVALQMTNSPKWLYCFWGLLMAGYKPLMINVILNNNETEMLIHEAGAKAIISERKDDFDVLTINPQMIKEDKTLPSDRAPWANEIAFCTSGTTGASRIFVFNGSSISYQIYSAYCMPFTSETILYPRSMGKVNVLAFIPFSHIFGFTAVVLWYTFFGQTLIFPQETSPKAIQECCQKENVSHIFAVPLFWDTVAKSFHQEIAKMSPKKQALVQKMLNYNLGKTTKTEAGFARTKIVRNIVQKKILGNNVTYCISGGSALSFETLSTINGIGYPLYNGYGMTEIGVTSVELSPSVKQRLLNSVGKPLTNAEYKVQEDGELLVKTPALHIARLSEGKYLPADVDENGYFHTQDIAKIDEAGYAFICGKKKDVIIGANGENIYPEQVEIYFKNLSHVSDSGIIGISKNNKEKPFLILSIQSQLNDTELQELKLAIKEASYNLPSSMQIRDILVTSNALPYNASMKLKRFELSADIEKNPSSFVGLDCSSSVSREGVNQVELEQTIEHIIDIFADVLLLDKASIAPKSDFMVDLNGDSFTYMNVIASVEDEFKTKIPVEQFGSLNSAEQFAMYLLKQKN